MTLAIDKLRRQARRAAVNFATKQWSDVKKVSLNQVTAWEDPKGYSVWEVEHTNSSDSTYVAITNAGLQAGLWD